MFTHIMVGANDIEASKTFYDAVLGTLGCKPGILSINPTDQKRYIYIHGTHEEGLIGKKASHGCIRMFNNDVVSLYEYVKEGTKVYIRA